MGYYNFTKDLVSKGLDAHQSHFNIAELWSFTEKQRGNVKDYEEKISQAVIDGGLVAEVSISNPKAIGGYEIIPYSPTILSQSKNGFLGGGYLQFYVHRDKFREWLVSSNQWPLADDCLLAKWFESEPQAEAVVDAITTKKKKNQQRDEDFKSWIEETSTNIDDMTKADIQAELIPRNRTLWTSGFDDWVKSTRLYAGTPGRKPG